MRFPVPSSTLWTIQPAEVLERIAASGIVRVERRWRRGDVPEAYWWLRKQLRRRLPGYRGGLPWWFYCQKPDIRCHRHGLWPRGYRLVRLEVELPTTRFVAFPSWAWHAVYCGQYLTASLAVYRRWEASLRRAVPDEDRWPLPEPWRGRLERSWNRLFTELPARPWPAYEREFGLSPRGREAVAETILASDVRDATLFSGSGTALRHARRLVRAARARQRKAARRVSSSETSPARPPSGRRSGEATRP